MKLLSALSKKSSHQILDYLYKDELMNVFLIHCIESKRFDKGQLYVNYYADKVQGVLHLREDGISNYTNFYTRSADGLKIIAHHIKGLGIGNMLLAGKEDEVKYIQECLDINKSMFLNTYYKLNRKRYLPLDKMEGYELVKAKASTRDMDYIMSYRKRFAEKEEDPTLDLSDDEIIRDQICNGVFFLEHFGMRIGLARFSSWSKHYIDIATVYIEEEYRSKGYGTILVKMMIEEALHIDKTPHHSNISCQHHSQEVV